MEHKLMCGAGKADITPPIGTILYGYAPGRPAESVGDNLEAVAIKLVSGENSALLITCTICSMNPELGARLRASAGSAAGVPSENVTVTCTHTHSGPNTSIKSGWGDVDNDYIENILIPGVTAAAAAAAEVRPAWMGVAETESDIGINRRALTEDGKITLGQNPWGPRDKRMTVVSFRDADNKCIANMVHYCCHCTASAMNKEITRDWAGVMTDMLEEETGGITGFYAGNEGDQGPNLPNGKTTGNYKMALQLGARAGIDAVRAYKSIKDWQDAPIKVLHGTIEVPYDPLPSREKAEEELKKLGAIEEIYAQRRFSDVNDHIHWTNVIAEHDSGKPPKTSWKFDQNITVIGPCAFIPCPFEAFVEIGLRLRRHSPYGYTMQLCNTHGSYAYLPTLGDMERGGYEVWHFLLAMRTTYNLPRRTDDFWVKQNLEIMREGCNRR